jgi:DNA-binding NarL/FixJ family response regulator
MHGETLEPLVYLTTKLRSLDGKLTLDQARRLLQLPAQLGYTSTDEFLIALREAVRAEAYLGTDADEGSSDLDATDLDATFDQDAHVPLDKAQVDAPDSHGVASESPASALQETPAKELEFRVRSMVEAGQSRAQIARELGISLARVQSIKKALGLVQPRAKRASKSETPPKPSPTKRRRSSE